MQKLNERSSILPCHNKTIFLRKVFQGFSLITFTDMLKDASIHRLQVLVNGSLELSKQYPAIHFHLLNSIPKCACSLDILCTGILFNGWFSFTIVLSCTFLELHKVISIFTLKNRLCYTAH